MKNLSTDYPIDKDLKPVKDSDGTNSALEISTDKVRVKDLEVTGTLSGSPHLIVDSSLTDGSTNPVTNNAVYDGLGTKQDSLTFGHSSGNALKSEEALTTNDILLAGSSNVKGRTYTELKSDLSLNNVTNDAQLPLAGGTMSGALDMGDQRILDAQRIGFNDGGLIEEVIDNDDMSSTSATKVSSSESIKAYVDSHIKYSESTYFYFAEETADRTYFRDQDDSNYPLKWDSYDAEYGSDADDTISLNYITHSSGIAVAYDSKLKGVRWMGYSGMNYDQRVDLQVWTGTIPHNSSSSVTATLRSSDELTDYKRKSFNFTTALDVSLSAGDMIYPAFRYVSGTSVLYTGSVTFLLERA